MRIVRGLLKQRQKKGIDVPTSDDAVLMQSKEIFNNTEWLASVEALCATLKSKTL